MFCPNCGKAEQTENTYCRSCGKFLGTVPPRRSLNGIVAISLIGTFLSLIAGLAMYLTDFNTTVVFFGAAVLLCNAVYHLVNAISGLKLQGRLSPAHLESLEKPAVSTRELLVEPTPRDFVPASVTERTTRNLEGIER